MTDRSGVRRSPLHDIKWQVSKTLKISEGFGLPQVVLRLKGVDKGPILRGRLVRVVEDEYLIEDRWSDLWLVSMRKWQVIEMHESKETQS